MKQSLNEKIVNVNTPAFVRNVVVSKQAGKICFESLTDDAPYMAFILADLSIPYENAKFCIENGISPEFSVEAVIF